MTDSGTDRAQTEEGVTPEDAFALVGNEIRAEILRVLGDIAQGHPQPKLTFSEIRERLDADITPRQLRYHLQQLVGHLVSKTDGSYHIRREGFHIYQSLRAGLFTKREHDTSIAAGFDCYYCQTQVQATFHDATITVRCPDCEYLYVNAAAMPPAGILGDETAAFAQFGKSIHYWQFGFARDVCPTCGNAIETEFFAPEEASLSSRQRRKVVVRGSCDGCGNWSYLTVGVALLADPGLVAFCYDHGVDAISTPFWELEFAATDAHVTVRSTAPWEVALDVTYDGDTLELVVDEDLTVLEWNRH